MSDQQTIGDSIGQVLNNDTAVEVVTKDTTTQVDSIISEPAAESRPVESPVVSPAPQVTTTTTLNTDLMAPAEKPLEKGIEVEEITEQTIVEKQLPPPIKKARQNTAWEIPLVLICILLVALSRYFNRRRFGLIMKTFFNSRTIPQYLREENAFANQVFATLSICFLVGMSMLILHASRIFFPTITLEPLKFFSQVALFIILVYICKFALLELLSEVFDQNQIVKEYIFNVILFNALVGICIIPVILANSLLFEFNNMLVISSLGLVALIYLYRNWRAIKMSTAYNYPLYYIFLYLCTLEILPGIVLLKLLKTQLN